MAFSIDFDVASAEQRVDTLSAKLREMTNLANNAMQALTPSQKAVEELKKVADAQKTISESLTKSAAAAKQEAQEFTKANKDKATSAQKFVKELEASIEKLAHKINAMTGAYGKSTQDMMKVKETLAKQAKDLATQDDRAEKERLRQQEANQRAQTAALKTWIAQHYREEQEAMNKRSAAWKAHYAEVNKEVEAKQKAQTAALKTWIAQHYKQEDDALKKRSAAWKAHYAEVNKEAEKSAREQAKLEKANHLGAKSAAGFRAALSALGLSFGIFTASTIVAATAVYAVVKAMVELGKGVKAATAIGMEFEKSMYRTFAVTGEMGTAYLEAGNLYMHVSKEVMSVQEEMANTAREAAKVTVFTAAEAAEGMVALGMAGMKADQVMGSLTSSLQLAQIGLISVYESADIMTNVMLGFGMNMTSVELSTASASRVVDVLTSSITNSNATIKQMANALSYVAPVAHTLGGSLEEVTAGLEVFHNVGIKGQRAGTSMRRMYANLAAQTDKTYNALMKLGVATLDSTGQLRSMYDIMTDLRDAGAGAADIFTIFGVRAGPAALAYMNNLEKVKESMDRLEETAYGVGKAMADFMATSSEGQWQIITSKFADTQIAAFNNFESDQKEMNVAIMNLIDNHGSKWTSVITSVGQMFFNASTWIVESIDESLTKLDEVRDTSKRINKIAAENPDTYYYREDTSPKTHNYTGYQKNRELFAQAEALRQAAEAEKKAAEQAERAKKAKEAAVAQAKEYNRLLEEAGRAQDLEIQNLSTIAELGNGAEGLIAHYTARVDANRRAAQFAKMEAEYLNDASFASFSLATERKVKEKSNELSYQQEFGVITEVQMLEGQLAAIEKAKKDLLEEFEREMEPISAEREKILNTRNNAQAETKAFQANLARAKQLIDQRDAAIRDLNEQEQSFIRSMEKATLSEAGYQTSGKGLADEVNKLEVNIAQLRGNTEATLENTKAMYANELVRRELYKSTVVSTWSETATKAFDAETEAIRENLAKLGQLSSTYSSLSSAAEFAKRSDKDVESLSKFVTSLEVANEKLKHNTKAADENKLEKYRLAIVERELFQSSKDFLSWTDNQRAAFIANTETMKIQVGQAEELSQANKTLAEDIARAKKMISGSDDEANALDEYVTSLRDSIAELTGNSEKIAENTLAKHQNVIASREQTIASREFLTLSQEEQEAYKAKTEAMKVQLAVARQLSDEELRAKSAKEASESFMSGKSLSDKGKGVTDFLSSIKQLQEYLDNREALIEQSGLSEIEITQMVAEAKIEAEQVYWDSQYENLAKWRDESVKSFADNMEEVLMIRQKENESDEDYAHRYKNRWKVAAQEVAATMVGTAINTMAKIAAEEAANYAMKAIFTSKRMTLDSMEANNKIAGEAAKQAANTATAASSVAASATEAAGMGSILVQLGAIVGMGPALIAALWPAATAMSILTGGAAATAAIGPLLAAGAAGAAAALISGVGGYIGNEISASGGTSGSRQFGGPVQKGKSYLVGETGREIFTPETNGYILNNQTTNNMVQGSGGSVTYFTYSPQFNVDARGNEDFEERISQAMDMAATQGKQAVLADLVNNGDIAKQVRNVSRT